jgi:hypothetical protein
MLVIQEAYEHRHNLQEVGAAAAMELHRDDCIHIFELLEGTYLKKFSALLAILAWRISYIPSL